MDRFDLALDEYQAREREAAERRAARGDHEAVRPGARRVETTFGELVVGDFMTAEEGPDARWVEVVEVEYRRKWTGEPSLDRVTITFRTPEPLGVAYTDRWVIERAPLDPIVIDGERRKALEL